MPINQNVACRQQHFVVATSSSPVRACVRGCMSASHARVFHLFFSLFFWLGQLLECDVFYALHEMMPLLLLCLWPHMHIGQTIRKGRRRLGGAYCCSCRSREGESLAGRNESRSEFLWKALKTASKLASIEAPPKGWFWSGSIQEVVRSCWWNLKWFPLRWWSCKIWFQPAPPFQSTRKKQVELFCQIFSNTALALLEKSLHQKSRSYFLKPNPCIVDVGHLVPLINRLIPPCQYMQHALVESSWPGRGLFRPP